MRILTDNSIKYSNEKEGISLKVTENVYALDSTKGNYAYLILDKEVILIDTGRPGQGLGILKELETMKISPKDIKHILLTHNDVDHIGNAAVLKEASGAKLWCSKEDLPYINGQIKRPGIKKYISAFIRVKPPQNIDTFGDEDHLDLIKVIKTPGHSPGHVSFLYKDVLFAGDLVISRGSKLIPSPGIMTWNTEVLIESIKKVSEYNFKWVCPAHGFPQEKDSLI